MQFARSLLSGQCNPISELRCNNSSSFINQTSIIHHHFPGQRQCRIAGSIDFYIAPLYFAETANNHSRVDITVLLKYLSKSVTNSSERGFEILSIYDVMCAKTYL